MIRMISIAGLAVGGHIVGGVVGGALATVGSMVTREQFEITDDGITHTPTGYFRKRNGDEDMGQLGKELPSGEYYRPDDVKEWAERLWIEHVRQKTLA
jgi:hypothetical protein